MANEVRTRWIIDEIHAALRDTPVVVVNGARQVGKSTLVSGLRYPGSVEIVTLDDRPTRDAARFDPRTFVSRSVDTLVIDEAQLEPGLFRAIKAEVDRDRRPGRFVLTGSSRLLAAPDMADALVGRVETIELWPFSQGEIEGRRDTFVEALFDDPAVLIRPGSLKRHDVVERVCCGGFPDAMIRDQARRARWFDAYLTTIVEKVVREISELERLAEIPRLLRMCAARTSNELNVASISNDLGIPARTGAAYLARLTTAFLVQLVPAWSVNVSAKVVRRPKVTLVDSGLAAYLVGATPLSLDRPGAPLGQLLETFVVNELRRQITWSSWRPSMWHFRDRSGAEVDVVLEAADGSIVGVEVKATASPSYHDFRGLRFLADRLGPRFRFGVVLCLAPEATRMGEPFAVLPIERLWT